MIQSNTLTQSRVILSKLLWAMSSQLLSIFRDEYSSTFLGNLIQSSNKFTVKKKKKKHRSFLFSSLNNPGLSSFPSMSDAPNHQLSLLSFAGFSLICPCLSCTGETRTGHGTPNVPCQIWPVGSVPPNAVQDAIVHLCSEGTLLTYVQLLHQDTQVLLCNSAFQLFDPQPVLVHGVIPPQRQDLAFLLLKFRRFLSTHFSSLFKVPLNSSTLICCSSHSSQFYVIYQYVKGELIPIIHIIKEEVTWFWPQY